MLLQNDHDLGLLRVGFIGAASPHYQQYRDLVRTHPRTVLGSVIAHDSPAFGRSLKTVIGTSDLLVIEVPTAQLQQVVPDVVEAGKKFFLQPPLGNTREEMLLLTNLINVAGANHVVSFPYRRMSALQELRQALAHQLVIKLEVSFQGGPVPFGDVIAKRDALIHLVDLLRVLRPDMPVSAHSMFVEVEGASPSISSRSDHAQVIVGDTPVFLELRWGQSVPGIVVKATTNSHHYEASQSGLTIDNEFRGNRSDVGPAEVLRAMLGSRPQHWHGLGQALDAQRAHLVAGDLLKGASSALPPQGWRPTRGTFLSGGRDRLGGTDGTPPAVIRFDEGGSNGRGH